MSSLCSDPEVEFQVGDKLRDLSLKYPDLQLSASGLASMLHIADVSMVQNALIDATSKHLLDYTIRYRCSECGSLNRYTGPPKDGLECLQHDQIEHDAVPLYRLTNELHEIAEKQSPKKALRRRAPRPNLASRMLRRLAILIREIA